MNRYTRLLCYLPFLFKAVLASKMRVILSNDGPAVQGSNITVVATLLNYDGSELRYDFWDDAQPQHSYSYFGNTDVTKCTIDYPRQLYEAGSYTVTVSVKKQLFGIYYEVAANITTFTITSSLNGNLVLVQNNTQQPDNYVVVNKTVNHFIQLPANEMQFLTINASTIVTYWFIDCVYIDQTTGLSFNFTYNDILGNHYVDALVVANLEPLPPLPTNTTTTTTTMTTTTTTHPRTTTIYPPTTTTITTTTTTSHPFTTTMTTTTTTNHPRTTTTMTTTTTSIQPPTTTETATSTTTQPPTTTTIKPDNNTRITTPHTITSYSNTTNSTSNDYKTLSTHNIGKRALSNKTTMTMLAIPSDFICKNGNIPSSNTYIYGHYQHMIEVREPIVPLNIAGNECLQHGELLNLQVHFSGSPPFNYCAQYKPGIYNVTGNETCKNNIRTISNSFPLVHYLKDSGLHTVVIIIRNDIGKIVLKTTVNIKNASVQPQISVFLVPLVFCLMAVTFLLFGIIYRHWTRSNNELKPKKSYFGYNLAKVKLQQQTLDHAYRKLPA